MPSASSSSSQLRLATPEDVPSILALIRELAEFERRLEEVVTTEDDLHRALFSERPVAEALMAEVEGQVAGFALFYTSFSTFAGKPGLHLEDIFVRPAYRGHGLGKALFLAVGRIAHERGCARYEWTVLDWNRNAIEFYERFEAEMLPDWRVMRLSGPSLEKLVSIASVQS